MTSERPQRSAERVEYLDGLRGVAALLVVIHHAVLAFDFALYDGLAEHAHGTWETAVAGSPLCLLYAGNFAVGIFFVLSGFVLFRAFGRRPAGPGVYVWRYIRLTGPILAVCLFSWLLLAGGAYTNVAAAPITRSPDWLAQQMPPTANFFLALREGLYYALIHVRIAGSYDSSLWTMKIEFLGSVLIFVVATIAAVVPPARRDGAVLALCALAVVAFWNDYLMLFPVGVALEIFARRGGFTPSPARGHRLVLAGVVGVGLLLGAMPDYANPWRIYQALLAATPKFRLWNPALGMPDPAFWHGLGAVLLVYGLLASPALQKFFTHKICLFLGRISFPLYLVHVPILCSVGCGVFLRLTAQSLPYAAAVALAVLSFVAVSLLTAWGAYYAVERPTLRLSRRVGERVDAALGARAP
jgi:peptidoglycan/LPS O-acetylase OafA/YrhL